MWAIPSLSVSVSAREAMESSHRVTSHSGKRFAVLEGKGVDGRAILTLLPASPMSCNWMSDCAPTESFSRVEEAPSLHR